MNKTREATFHSSSPCATHRSHPKKDMCIPHRAPTTLIVFDKKNNSPTLLLPLEPFPDLPDEKCLSFFSMDMTGTGRAGEVGAGVAEAATGSSV